MESPSDRLKKALEIREMRQADLVEATGISKSSISTYLSGKFIPKQNNIQKLAQALNVSEAWLMGCDVPMDKQDEVEQALKASFPDIANDVWELRDTLRHRPEMKVLFDTTKNASKEDIEKAVRIIEALKDEK